MIKKIINFLLNLIMSILVLGLISICIIITSVLNKEYMKARLIENNFYDRSYGDIKEDFENYTMQSGLELDILDGLFTKEKVENDINIKLNAIYDGKKADIETDSIRNELDSRINNVLEQNNRILSSDEKKSVDKYEDVIADSYKSGILYGKDFSISKDFKNLINAICIAIVISIIMISIILIIINKSFIKYISFIGINLLFSGILCISVKFLLADRIVHILFMDAKFSKLLVSTLSDIISRFYYIGIAAVIVGCTFIIIGSYKKWKKLLRIKIISVRILLL